MRLENGGVGWKNNMAFILTPSHTAKHTFTPERFSRMQSNFGYNNHRDTNLEKQASQPEGGESEIGN